MRGNLLTYILLVILALMIFGVVSLGDVVGFIFYAFTFIILVALVLAIVFRYRVNRMRRRMHEQMNEQMNGGDPAGGRRGARQRRPEGEVTVKRTVSSSKVVSSDVGSYVEYEEIEEEETVSK